MVMARLCRGAIDAAYRSRPLLVDAFLRDPDSPRILRLAAIPDCVGWLIGCDSEGMEGAVRSHWQCTGIGYLVSIETRGHGTLAAGASLLQA